MGNICAKLHTRLPNKKPKFVIDEADDEATVAVGLRAWFGLGPPGSNYDDRNPIFRSGIFRSLSITTRLNFHPSMVGRQLSLKAILKEEENE